ncbi:MAG: phosphatase PAP2 family protein [Flavobacteriales bacterium]|jgi:membrane-associated phospholipid phosphatase
MKDFFRVVAVVFHPLFMPVYVTLIAMYYVDYIYFAIDPKTKDFLLVVMAVNVFAPAMSLGTMVSRKIISDIQVSIRKERYIPFLLMLFYFCVTYLLLRCKLGSGYLPSVIYSMFCGVICSLVIALLVSFRFKISIHTLGASGVLGAICAFSHMYQFNATFNEYFWISLLAGVLGLVGASRIYTGHHTLIEVLVGSSVGFLINYLVVGNNYFL